MNGMAPLTDAFGSGSWMRSRAVFRGRLGGVEGLLLMWWASVGGDGWVTEWVGVWDGGELFEYRI